MSDPALANHDADALAMRSAGALAYVRAELDALEADVAAVPDWRPGRTLLAEAAWVRERLDELGAAWGGKLVVAIAGPSGAGKSTLLNALAGQHLSPTGFQRPTTREFVVYAGRESDADPLAARVGAEALTVHVAPASAALEHLILVDTPDTNTLPENQRLLAALLDGVDVLITLFPAQNPRLQDNLAFLTPYVRRMPADAVVPVLNQVDRVPEGELDGIASGLRRDLAALWGRDVERLYLVSARASLDGAGFAADEEPLHGVNEFAALRGFIYGALNRASQVADRRLARAEHLLALVRAHAAELLAERRAALEEADRALQALESDSRQVLGQALAHTGGRGAGLAAQGALFDLLAERWWGPVGWLVVVWALILRLARFLGGIGARPNPALASGDAAQARVLSPAAATEALEALETLYAEAWPRVAEALVRAGYQPEVRESVRWREALRQSAGELADRAAALFAGEVARLAERLSGWALVLLGNLPVLALLGWLVYDTVTGFLERDYLGADYFRHAGIALLVVWLATFAIVQVVAAWSLRRTVRRGVVRALASSRAGAPLWPLHESLRHLLALARASVEHPAGAPLGAPPSLEGTHA